MKLLITDIFGSCNKAKSEMTSYLKNGYDVTNYFAKFEKFLPHNIVIPSFMTVVSQMPELGGGLFCPTTDKVGSQNTQYKLGFTAHTPSDACSGYQNH